MAKIKGVKIVYPEGIDEKEGHREMQNKAMKILADYLVKKLPRKVIEELIERL